MEKGARLYFHVGKKHCFHFAWGHTAYDISVLIWSKAPAGPGDAQAAYIIPPDTSIQTVVMADTVQHSCSLAVTTDHDTVVRGVMLFAEQVRQACATCCSCLFTATHDVHAHNMHPQLGPHLFKYVSFE